MATRISVRLTLTGSGLRRRAAMGRSAHFPGPYGPRDLECAAIRIPDVNRREFLLAAASLPLALRIAPQALAGGTPLALVTADTESMLVAVELGSGRIHRRVATLAGPRSIESVGGRLAVVAHTTEGAVSIVAGDTLEVVRVLRGFAEPRYTAARADGRFAFVTDSQRGEVATVDLERLRVVARLELGGPARHVTISPDGRLLWTSLGAKAPEVVVVDVSEPLRPRLRRRIAPPFLAHDVGFVPGGGRVWVTSGDRGRIAVYDSAQAKVLFTLPADAPPQHVTFLDGRAHVTSGDDGTLRVHRAQDGRELRTTAVPVGSYNVQQGFGLILTPSLDRGTLCVVSPAGKVLKRVQAAASSHDACFVMSR